MNDGPVGQNPLPQDAVVAQITITLSGSGQVQVNGPMQNRPLMYGLLEVAKDVVRDMARESERRIMPAPPGIMHLIDNKKGS